MKKKNQFCSEVLKTNFLDYALLFFFFFFLPTDWKQDKK